MPTTINEMPNELLELVFSYYRYPTVMAAQPLSADEEIVWLHRVSRRWGAIVRATPELWPHFEMELGQIPTRRLKCRLIEPLCLSEPLPISLSFRLFQHIPTPESGGIHFLLGSLAAHSKRWWKVQTYMPIKCLEWTGIDSEDCLLPRLESLNINCLERRPVRLFEMENKVKISAAQAPLLRKVRVYDCNPPNSIHLPWEQLTSLIMDIDCFAYLFLLRDPPRLVSLENLEIRVEVETNRKKTFKLLFPKLRRLTFELQLDEDTSFRELVKDWGLPALEELVFSMNEKQTQRIPIMFAIGHVLANFDPKPALIIHQRGVVGEHIWRLLDHLRPYSVQRLALESSWNGRGDLVEQEQSLCPDDFALTELQELTIDGPIPPRFLRRLMVAPDGRLPQPTPALQKVTWRSSRHVQDSVLDDCRRFIAQERPEVLLYIVIRSKTSYADKCLIIPVAFLISPYYCMTA